MNERRSCRLAALAALAFAGAAAAADYIPPPRSVDDILAVLDQYEPNAKSVEKRKLAAEQPVPQTSDKAKLAEFYFERSRARGALGLISKQIEDLRLAARYAAGTMAGATAGGRHWPGFLSQDPEAVILNDLGRSEMIGGNFVNAVQTWQQRLRSMESQSRPRRGVLIGGYTDLAIANADIGDLAKAKTLLARADAVYAGARFKGKNPALDRWAGFVERARGRLAMAEGKYRAAETSFQKALASMNADRLAEKQRDAEPDDRVAPGFRHALRNEIQASLARVLMQQGRLAEAEAAARRGLLGNLSFYGRYSVQSASDLNGLSEILAEEGRFSEAALLGAAAIDSLEKSGAAPESMPLANARRAYGTALVAQEKWPEALGVFELMQAGLANDPVVARQFGHGDLNWAYALVKAGRAAAAVSMLRPLLEESERRLGEKDRSVAELHGYLGIALAASGERDAALKEFQRAVPRLVKAARVDQALETGGTARWMRTINILEAYLDLLAAFSGTNADAAAEAFRIADFARGSSVQRALAESAARGAVHDTALADIARKEQDAHHRIAVLSDLLSRLAAAPPEQQLGDIIQNARRELDQQRAEQVRLRVEIERRFPDYAELTEPKPLTVTEAQALLKPGEALISIYVTPARTYAWALPQQGPVAFTVADVGRVALAKRVSHLREALDIGDASLAAFPKFDLAASYALYADILRPLESALNGATALLVVPHGPLGHLPFAVLTTAPSELKTVAGPAFAAYRDAPWLIKRASITQLPSVGTLAMLRRSAAPSPGRRSFIGFGDPVFGKEQMAEAAAPPATVTRGVRLRNLAIGKVQSKTVLETDDEGETDTPPPPVSVTNSSGLGQLAPLPDTSEEILRIAEVLGASAQDDVYLKLRANESLLKKMDLSNRRVIAFATHGLLPGDLNGLTQPALALSAPDVVGGADDGLLTMEEILALKLDADWVVLSACNTASGDGAGAEAVSGLGRAFFFAGARALLVSNWPVETTSARMLTTGLFRQQAEKQGLSRAEALRQAMLDLMNGPAADGGAFTYAHPMFWAPFSLVGEGAAR